MLGTKLDGLEEYLINLKFEEDRRFYYSELPEVSKEIIERMKGGLIEDFAVLSYEPQECVLYVKR